MKKKIYLSANRKGWKGDKGMPLCDVEGGELWSIPERHGGGYGVVSVDDVKRARLGKMVAVKNPTYRNLTDWADKVRTMPKNDGTLPEKLIQAIREVRTV